VNTLQIIFETILSSQSFALVLTTRRRSTKRQNIKSTTVMNVIKVVLTNSANHIRKQTRIGQRTAPLWYPPRKRIRPLLHLPGPTRDHRLYNSSSRQLGSTVWTIGAGMLRIFHVTLHEVIIFYT